MNLSATVGGASPDNPKLGDGRPDQNQHRTFKVDDRHGNHKCIVFAIKSQKDFWKAPERLKNLITLEIIIKASDLYQSLTRIIW